MLLSRFRWRIAVALGVLAGSTWLWWSCALTPLQRWYFWPYLNCSLQGDGPGFYSEIHWLYKTAPRIKHELATDQDTVSPTRKRVDLFPVELSPTARKEGWTGLIRGPEEWIEIRRLQPFLRQEFYGGQNLWKMLLTPLLWSVAALLCLIGVEEFLRSRSRKQPDYVWTLRTIRRGLSPGLLTRWPEALRIVRSGWVKITKALARVRDHTPRKIPITPAGESAGKSVQTTVPLFGAGPGTSGEKPIWRPRERDRLM